MSAPSTKLLLVRHGDSYEAGTPYGPDTPLNALGRSQVIAVAEALSEVEPISAIYTSPFPRAIDSANPLAARLGLTPLVDGRLAEFELPPADSPEDQTLPIWRADHRGTPHGETIRDFSLRVADFLEEISEQHLDTTLAAFAHSGTIDAVARWAVGLAAESHWQHDLPLSPASITELEIWPHGRVPGGAPRYVAFHRVGDTAHLGSVEDRHPDGA
jgi:probable phosphoglycerate mutase